MALSNAERQRRYRQRLKDRAADGEKLLEVLNEAHAGGRAEERNRLLPLLRQQARALSPEVAVRWEAAETALQQLATPAGNEQWRQRASELGQREEEVFLKRLLRECVADAESTAGTPPPGGELPPSASPYEPENPSERAAQLKMADRFEKILQNRD